MTADHASFTRTDDEALFAALRSGNSKEVNQAVSYLQQYKEDFIRHMMQVLRQYSLKFNRAEIENDLEDVFQDAMIKFVNHVQRNPPKFEPRKEFFRSMRSYIFKCGKYIFLNRHRALITQDEIKKELGVLQNDREDGMITLIKKEQRNNLATAMTFLDDHCKRLLEQRYFEEMAPRDIAGLSNEKANTVAQQILRCREKLKQTLTNQHAL